MKTAVLCAALLTGCAVNGCATNDVTTLDLRTALVLCVDFDGLQSVEIEDRWGVNDSGALRWVTKLKAKCKDGTIVSKQVEEFQ